MSEPSKQCEDSDVDIEAVDDEPVLKKPRQQEPPSKPSAGISEKGRRFLIDCLLNLPKEETQSSNVLDHSNTGSSTNCLPSTSLDQSAILSSTSTPEAAPNFSWNGLSKPSEIRKVYSANTTWPLWIYYTRYTHRPQALQAASSSNKQLAVGQSASTTHSQLRRLPNGRVRAATSTELTSSRPKSSSAANKSSRRVRLAFTADQLKRLKEEFECNHYLNEPRRKAIAVELNLKESQVKVWFQNKRAQLRRICNASSFFFLQPSSSAPEPNQ